MLLIAMRSPKLLELRGFQGCSGLPARDSAVSHASSGRGLELWVEVGCRTG